MESAKGYVTKVPIRSPVPAPESGVASRGEIIATGTQR